MSGLFNRPKSPNLPPPTVPDAPVEDAVFTPGVGGESKTKKLLAIKKGKNRLKIPLVKGIKTSINKGY
ncbi:hypothetical protein AV947_gp34 [Podophage Lau218]|uniref:Putative phage protein n=2 Tax=Lauvirus lau218 TaxID=1465639 RepID=A0A060BKX0_9CAUD|nr:hypothetical protein AV947_gp34 [Podophage Lau218]AIA83149.1 putative phage protein [Podophage Lau218]AIA83197.1 putative phage protein [Lauvirus lau218]AIA83247.1 putative phage protein [Lauvirus lau218]